VHVHDLVARAVTVLLRTVSTSDLDAYIRMRCDAAMMAHLGGPRPVEEMEDKLRRDVANATADREWTLMICPGDDPSVVAGTVSLWLHEVSRTWLSEIGWMVLPEYQGKGLAKRAVGEVLSRAFADGRWGSIHAFPGVGNAPSNAICRSLGFALEGEQDFVFAGKRLRVNHWVIGPAPDQSPGRL
jgi:RimJ/RimL family protein N-acetyltransferase